MASSGYQAPLIKYAINANVEDVEIESDSSTEGPVNEISTLTTFILSINFIVGAGVFSMPFVFYQGGILYGAGVLLVVTCTLITTSFYVLEVCARAQALETVINESDIPDLTFHDVSLIGKRNYGTDDTQSTKIKLLPKPKYKITSERKFEFTELMEIFFGLPGRIVTASSIVIYLWTTLMAYGSIFGSTWAMTLPWNISVQVHNQSHMIFGHCELSEFDKIMPGGFCLNTYRLSVGIYGLIVIPMCMMNVASMKPIQLGLSFMMQVTMITAIGHCIYGLAVGNIAGNQPRPHPSHFTDFNFKGFLCIIPIVLYGQVLHEGIPMIAQPSKVKKNLHKVFCGALCYSGMLYLCFAVSTALRFREDCAPMATLNWTETSKVGYPIIVRMISYMILMTPSIVVCACYPMCAITMTANLFILFTGKDAHSDPSWDFKFKLLTASFSTPPIIAALFIANLKTIAKYAGLIAFLMTMVYPIMLQVASRKKCRKVFGKVDQWLEQSIAASMSLREEDRQPLLNKYARIRDVMTMTPYYSSWWSRTTVVVIFSCISGILALFGLMSAFTNPPTVRGGPQ